GGNHTLDSTSQILGNAKFSGGSTTGDGAVTGTGAMTVTGGTGAFGGAATSGGVGQSGGLFTGDGWLRATGLSALSGGTQGGSGTTVLQGGASITLTGFGLDGDRTLELGGTSSVTGTSTQIRLNAGVEAGSGTLKIGSGGTLDDQTTNA